MNITLYLEILQETTKLDSNNALKCIQTIINYEDVEDLLYEIIGLLDANESFDNILKNISENNFAWNNTFYNKFYEKRLYKDNMLAKPPEIREGEIECPKCHLKKTLVVEMQTRSADEGFTYAIHCFNPKCKAKTK